MNLEPREHMKASTPGQLQSQTKWHFQFHPASGVSNVENMCAVVANSYVRCSVAFLVHLVFLFVHFHCLAMATVTYYEFNIDLDTFPFVWATAFDGFPLRLGMFHVCSR